MEECNRRSRLFVLPACYDGDDGPGTEILVPLTQSLYVPGKVKEADKVLIDIGEARSSKQASAGLPPCCACACLVSGG